MTTITLPRAVVEQALEAIEDLRGYRKDIDEAITALRTALAQEHPNLPGCEHCNHPLYAATKCRVCGRVTEPKADPTYKTYPIRMKFEWVGGQWLFNDKPIESGEWNITLKDGGWVIYPKMEHAAPVAWYYERDTEKGLSFAPDRNPYKRWQPLYTAPPQRKPLTEEEIERIRADEREACARVCEETTAAWTQHLYNSGCVDCAAAIRARSKE